MDLFKSAFQVGEQVVRPALQFIDTPTKVVDIEADVEVIHQLTEGPVEGRILGPQLLEFFIAWEILLVREKAYREFSTPPISHGGPTLAPRSE